MTEFDLKTYITQLSNNKKELNELFRAFILRQPKTFILVENTYRGVRIFLTLLEKTLKIINYDIESIWNSVNGDGALVDGVDNFNHLVYFLKIFDPRREPEVMSVRERFKLSKVVVCKRSDFPIIIVWNGTSFDDEQTKIINYKHKTSIININITPIIYKFPETAITQFKNEYLSYEKVRPYYQHWYQKWYIKSMDPTTNGLLAVKDRKKLLEDFIPNILMNVVLCIKYTLIIVDIHEFLILCKICWYLNRF